MRPMNLAVAKIILFEVKEILDELGIEFWLHYGVCLGAHREGNFIEYDKDIDLGVKHEVIVPRMKELKAVFFSHGYRMKAASAPFPYERALSVYKNSIHTDIVGFALNKLDRFSACTFKDRCTVHKASFFENMATINFLGKEFLVPTPIEEYLESEYGPTWRIPQSNFLMRNYPSTVHGYWAKTEYSKKFKDMK